MKKMTKNKEKNRIEKNLPKEVQIVVNAGQEKMAQDLIVLDLRKISDFTDYFIIMHGRSVRQNIALYEHIESELKKNNVRVLNIEGKERAEWVLMDYGHFIVHIFSPYNREYYSLEKLWGDAVKISC